MSTSRVKKLNRKQRATLRARERKKTAKANDKTHVKGFQIFRPFVIGSIARPIPTDQPRPADIPGEHTHRWTIYVKGVDDVDITYWLKKVSFQLHDTYANRNRNIESPPFEVSETGWGEFEVKVQLYFVPEANEKAGVLWHAIKLHAPGNTEEERQEYLNQNGGVVINEDYNEIVFNEPTEQFFELMTSGAAPIPPVSGIGSGRGGKSVAGKGMKAQQAAAALAKRQGDRSAEIPTVSTPENPYSQRAEQEEVAFLQGKNAELNAFFQEEMRKLKEAEQELEEVKKS